MTNDLVNVGLKNCREKAGYTQHGAAKKLKISQAAIAYWESGRSLPKTETLPEIAKLYKCTIEDLLKKGRVK